MGKMLQITQLDLDKREEYKVQITQIDLGKREEYKVGNDV